MKTLGKLLLLALVFGLGAATSVFLLAPDRLNQWFGHDLPGSGAMPEDAVEHAVKHLDPDYVCPMHPQIIRNQPGTCPICGMDLVLKEPDQSAAQAEREILYWVAPMDPSYRRDGPGKSPMGMDLVPVYVEEGPTVTVNPTIVNSLGVRTATVERGRLWRRISTVGYVDYDETRMSHVHTRVEGWVEKLYVRAEGEAVKKGEPLLELYSPELVNAQEEFLQARRSGNEALIRASRERLRALDLSETQIRQLEQRGKASRTVTLYADQNGIVARLNTPEGMFVKPATEVMSLADLSRVWVLAEVFQQQADWVREGQIADVNLSYLPGREWEGRVQYIYPDLDPRTRALKVRLEFDNPGGALKPNMYADVVLYGGPKQDVLYIPREALIRTGENERVILDKGEGRFAARQVRSGIESGDYVEIVDGLREGERVVTSGQFLIDSEASLRATLQRMGAADVEPAPVTGTGVIKEMMPGKDKLRMAHDPVPELGWPAMVMDFELAPGAAQEGLAAGDVVEFELGDADAGYPVIKLRRRDMPGPSQ